MEKNIKKCPNKKIDIIDCVCACTYQRVSACAYQIVCACTYQRVCACTYQAVCTCTYQRVCACTYQRLRTCTDKKVCACTYIKDRVHVHIKAIELNYLNLKKVKKSEVLSFVLMVMSPCCSDGDVSMLL